MAKIETWFTQDLNTAVKPHSFPGEVFNNDSLGNLIGVEVTKDGEPFELTGSVNGYCVLSNGETIPVAGNRLGNKASIVLPQTAYSVRGVIKITLKLTNGNETTTLLQVVGAVDQSVTGNMVNPGSVVQDWSQQIAAALQELQDAENNFVRVDTDSQGLTEAKKRNGRTNIDAASVSDVDELKSADNNYELGYLPKYIIKNSYVERNGVITPYAGWDRTDYIPVRKYNSFIAKTSVSSAYNVFYDESHEKIGANFNINSTPTEIQVPDGAYYVMFSNTAAGMETLEAEFTTLTEKNLTELQGAIRASRLAFEYGWISFNDINKNGTYYHIKYIPCTPGETFVVHNALTDNQYAFAVLFFGIDGLYLSGVGKNVGGDTLNVTVPENAYFFGINKKTEATNCWVEYGEVNYKPVETALKSQMDSALSLKQSKNRTQLDAYWMPGYFSRVTFFPQFGNDAYNFRHIIIYLNKSFDLVFSGADTSNQYVYYLFFMDFAFNAITNGKRTNTGNTEDTVLAADFPTDAVYAVITYKTTEIANAQIKNGPSAFDTYFVDPYTATRAILSSGLIKQEAYSWRGWIGHDSDTDFERIIVKLKKDANLVFTGADTSNQYFDYLRIVDAEGNYLTEGKRKQTGNTEDTVFAADFPADAVYAVITYKAGKLKSSTITNGSVVQFVPPNTFELLNSGGDEPVEPTAIAEIVIPSEVTAVVGDTLQIYYDSIVKSTEPVKVEFLGTKGNALERYFEYTPIANDVGNSSIVINVRKYDNLASSYSTIVATKTITLKTIAIPTSPSTEKHVLCVGDSTIVGGAYVKELARRICGTGGAPSGNNLSNIKFTGRLNKTVDDIVVCYEGFSGWSWNSYISGATKAIRFYVSGVTSLNFEAVYQDSNGCQYNIAEVNVTGGSGNIRCLYVMGSASTTPPTSGTLTRVSGSGDSTIAYTNMEVEQFAPFVDNGQVTFVPYVTEYCGGSVDYVLFSLGTNVIVNSNAEFSTIKANMLSQMDTLISKLHEQYPSAIVLLCTLQKGSMNGGFGANFGSAYNASSDFYNHKVYELNQAYIEFASTRNYVKLVDVSGEFDTIYDFPHMMKNVNVRNSAEKEMVDTNFGHPSTVGYMQMADAMYRALCNTLTN